MTGERKARLAKLAAKLVRDVTALAGIGLLSAAGWMIYQPIGLIIPGVFLAFVGLAPSRSK